MERKFEIEGLLQWKKMILEWVGLAGERSVGEVARWRGGEFGTESVQWQRAGWEVDVVSSGSGGGATVVVVVVVVVAVVMAVVVVEAT